MMPPPLPCRPALPCPANTASNSNQHSKQCEITWNSLLDDSYGERDLCAGGSRHALPQRKQLPIDLVTHPMKPLYQALQDRKGAMRLEGT